MELCCQRNLPLIFLQNIIPNYPDSLSMEEQACLIKDQAKMMSAVACAEVNFHGIFFRCEKIDLCVNYYILWLSLSALLKLK